MALWGSWSPEYTAEALRLYNTEGKTVYEIGNSLGFSAKSVYNYLKQEGQHFRSSGPRLKKIRVHDNAEALGYLVGILLGDGHLRRSAIVLKVVDKDFAQSFCKALEDVFDGITTNVRQYAQEQYTQGHVFTAYGCSKTAVEFLSQRTNVTWCRKQNVDVKVGILRGLWDSEGSITLSNTRQKTSPYYPIIKFSVASKHLAMLYVQLVWEVLGIQTKTNGPYTGGMYDVVIRGYDKASLFYRMVNPTIKRKRRRFEKALEVIAC